jgi:hypothetical protein
MKKSSINEYLNKDNIWTERMLNNSFSINRNIDHVQKEYNEDKYKKLLDNSLLNINQLKAFQWNQNQSSKKTHISLVDEIFECTSIFAQSLVDTVILNNVTNFGSENICELGSGYGYNLTLFEKSLNLYGGELTESGVKIGKSKNLDVNLFNFYNKQDYKIVRPNSTVFTHHALEQIPDSKCFVEYLANFKDNINYVVNIEPSFLSTRKNLIGILRNKYNEINDYNRNIHELTRNHPEIDVVFSEDDVIGNGPLNSSCITVWRFHQ